jgi:hypothetical protein
MRKLSMKKPGTAPSEEVKASDSGGVSADGAGARGPLGRAPAGCEPLDPLPPFLAPCLAPFFDPALPPWAPFPRPAPAGVRGALGWALGPGSVTVVSTVVRGGGAVVDSPPEPVPAGGEAWPVGVEGVVAGGGALDGPLGPDGPGSAAAALPGPASDSAARPGSRTRMADLALIASLSCRGGS